MSSALGRLALLGVIALAAPPVRGQLTPPPALPPPALPPQPGPGPAATPPAPGGTVPAVPAGALVRIGGTRLSHGGYAVIVAYAPDGKTIASGGNDRLVRIWDVATGRELRRFTGHTSNVDTVAYSVDGKRLASGSADGTIRLWDPATGAIKGVLRNPGGSVNCVAFSPDGKHLASKGHDGQLRLWDLATSQVVRSHPASADHGTSNVVFTPDGKNVVAVDQENCLHLWDVATGNDVRRFVGHQQDVHSLDVSPDGKWLASASMDRTLRLWDVATGKEVRQFTGHTDLVSAVRFSPDRKTLGSCAGDRSIRLWELETGKEIRQMQGHVALVSEISFSPDGKTLASASWDHTVRLWDVATGKELPQSQRDGGPLVCAVLSPDGKTVAAGHNDGVLRLWEAATGKVQRVLAREPSAPIALAYSPAGDLLAARTLDGAVVVYETATGKRQRELVPATVNAAAMGALNAPRPVDATGTLAFSPDGKFVAAITTNAALKVWEVVTGREVASPGKEAQAPLRIAFSSDGKLLAGACRDGAARLWSTSTWQEVRQLTDAAGPRRVATSVAAVAFSPDARTVAAPCSDGTLRVWELASGQVRHRVSRPGERFAVVLPGGTVASASGMMVRLWGPRLNRELRALTGHGAMLTSLTSSADGRRLTSVGNDGTAVVWDLGFLEKEGRPPMAALAPAALDAHWAALAGADALRAGEAITALIAGGEMVAVALRDRLKPAGALDPKQIDKLVIDLDDDDFTVRERASKELEKAGGQAGAALRRALKADPSAEAQRRILELLRKVEGGAASGDRLRGLRAMEVLEGLGGPEARKTLEAIARGPTDDPLAAEARAVLDRLTKRADR